MEGVLVELRRKKRSSGEANVRRSLSCSNLGELFEPRNGESKSTQHNRQTDNEVTNEKRKLARGKASRRKKKSEPVISAPVQPSSIPQRSSIYQHVRAVTNNPFGTIGRRNKRKSRQPMPVVMMQTSSGPPPSPSFSPSPSHSPSPSPSPSILAPPDQRVNKNPFATLPRRAPHFHSNADEADGRPASLIAPSTSPLLHTPHSRAALCVDTANTANTTNGLIVPDYQELIGKSLDKVCQ